MAEMLPKCKTDAEVDELISGAGCTGERLLYKLMRDYLPNDWCVIWNRRISNSTTNHQYDFIVLVPGKGVLELDAKGHGYGYNDDGVLGCFHKGSFTQDSNLFEDVQGAKEDLRRTLITEFGPFGACNCLVAFIDQFVKNDKNPAASDWIDRIKDRLENDNQCLKEKIETILSAQINGLELSNFHHYFDDKMMKKIKEFFAQRNGWEIRFQDDFYKWDSNSKNYLSSRQQFIFDQADEYGAMHIKGAAGTGKTIIAIMLAKSFAQQGKRVLYVCYNRKLADFLNRKNRNEHWQNITITNYDSIGSISLAEFRNELLRQRLNWRSNPRNMAFWNDNEWSTERERISYSLYNPPNNKSLNNFDVLIIDEAQDLDNKYIGSLFGLKKANGKIFIFSDENQSIYSVDWSLNTEILFSGLEYDEVTLLENWRNSRQIHNHFAPIVEDQSKPTFKGVVEVTTIKHNQVQECLTNLIQKKGRQPKNIALLSIGGANINQFSAIPNGNGTTYQISDNLNNWYDDQCILKTSVEGFKGLDADIVFLFGDKSLPKNNSLHDQREKDRYVGESRAKYELYIVEEE